MISVTRFGEISPLWPNIISLGQFFDGLKVFAKIVTLVKSVLSIWPKKFGAFFSSFET